MLNNFFTSISDDDIEEAKKGIENGIDVNVRFSFGMSAKHEKTPLFYSLEFGNEELIKYILEKGADVNSINGETKDTPLHEISSGFLSICKILVKKGADVNAKNTLDQTPLHLVFPRKSGH